MRTSSVTRIVAALAVFAAARSTAAQESWLPYGKVGAADIAVSPDGVVWLIAREPHSIRFNLVLGETQFVTPPGSPARVAADLNGFAWLLNTDGSVWHYERNAIGKEDWVQSPLKAIDIAVGANGAVWAIDTDHRIVQLRNGAWKSIGGEGLRIAVDPSGNPWIVSPAGKVSHWTGKAWTQVPGSATDITVAADGTVFILGTTPVHGGFDVLRLNGSSWEEIAGGAGLAISASAGDLYVAQDVSTNQVLSSAIVRLRTTADASTATSPATPTTNARSSENKGGSVPKTPESEAAGALGKLGGLLSKGATGAAGAGGAAGSPANLPHEPNVPGARLLAKLPIPGSLRCPIIGAGATMQRGCELLGRAAMKLRQAPSPDCPAQSFADSRNGGECWTCPAGFTRSNTPVDADDACAGPAAKRSVATLVKGCAMYKAPPGYGTPFRASSNGSECWVCPFPLQPSLSAVASLTSGNLSACFGKAKQLFVWQLGQFPEAGSYNFMPGLLSIALADPKAVDVFLDKRSNGDTARKREMWAQMIADPSSCAELKALLFASLLSVAKQDSANALAKDAVHEFELYMQRRRSYVAGEAFRMYRKAREVDAYYEQAKDSAGAIETAATDFKTYAWSSVIPDSAGTAFIVASSALAQLGAGGGVEGVADAAISSLHVRYLEPVTKALEDELDMLRDKRADLMEKAGTLSTIANGVRALRGADPAMIGTTLLGGAMRVSQGVMNLFGKDKVAAEYEKYVNEMSVPVRVRDMVESTNPEDRQSLLLYWALATSAHKAADKIGTGAMTGAELCNSDSWTAAECSSAKEMIQAAAKAVGY